MDMLLSLIFVQNVCKDYQQTTKVLASEERILLNALPSPERGNFIFIWILVSFTVFKKWYKKYAYCIYLSE